MSGRECGCRYRLAGLMSEIRLLHGPDVRETLKDEGEIAVFRYRLNTPVFTVALLVGAALLAIGGFVWWNYGFSAARWTLAIAIPSGAGIAIGAVAAYWYYFSETNFVAFSDDHVYVGERDRMWSVDWSLLDREALGFEEMSVSSLGGSLELDVAGQQIPVRLYSAFVQLENIQGFMYKILQHLKEQADLDEEDIDAPEDLLAAGVEDSPEN